MFVDSRHVLMVKQNVFSTCSHRVILSLASPPIVRQRIRVHGGKRCSLSRMYSLIERVALPRQSWPKPSTLFLHLQHSSSAPTALCLLPAGPRSTFTVYRSSSRSFSTRRTRRRPRRSRRRGGRGADNRALRDNQIPLRLAAPCLPR
jgi:hypothetical protein